MPASPPNSASASARSSGRLMLKKGSILRPPMSMAREEDLLRVMVRDPCLDLSHAACKRRFERRRERDRPQPEDRMHSFLRPRHQQPGLAILQWQRRNRATRSVGKKGVSVAAVIDEAAPGPIGTAPIRSRHGRRRAVRLAAEAILDDWQAKCRKPSHVAIGIDDEVRDLGPQTIDDVSEHRLAGERQQAFVAAAHAARSAASKQNADDDFRQFHARSLGL